MSAQDQQNDDQFDSSNSQPPPYTPYPPLLVAPLPELHSFSTFPPPDRNFILGAPPPAHDFPPVYEFVHDDIHDDWDPMMEVGDAIMGMDPPPVNDFDVMMDDGHPHSPFTDHPLPLMPPDMTTGVPIDPALLYFNDPPLPTVGTHVPVIDDAPGQGFLLPQGTHLELTDNAQMLENLLNFNDARDFHEIANGLPLSADNALATSLNQPASPQIHPTDFPDTFPYLPADDLMRLTAQAQAQAQADAAARQNPIVSAVPSQQTTSQQQADSDDAERAKVQMRRVRRRAIDRHRRDVRRAEREGRPPPPQPEFPPSPSGRTRVARLALRRQAAVRSATANDQSNSQASSGQDDKEG